MTDRRLDIGPCSVRLRSPLLAVARHLDFHYGSHDGGAADAFTDFDVRVLPGTGPRRLWRPQARFLLDDIEPFYPLPGAQAAPLFEWGLNWCVAQRPLGYLVMHAAVVAHDDAALMLPGFPGAGKSTLCASLVFMAGWRLLSDELAILDPASGCLLPHPRPVSLKNESIALVAAMPGARVGEVYRDTRKGDIAHATCPAASVQAAHRPARVRWVVFPKFDAGGETQCEEIGRTEAFTLIAEQSFNKDRMGATGFDALCALLGGARCFEMRYASTGAALGLIRQITGT